MKAAEPKVHVGNDPALCCLTGAWDRMAAIPYGLMHYGEPLPPEVAETAASERVEPHELAHHVEGVHGWEPHDHGYAKAVAEAAACMKAGGCESARPEGR